MKPRVLFVDHVGVLGGGELSLFDIAVHFGEDCGVVLFDDGPFRHKLEKAKVTVEVLPMAPAIADVKRGAGRAAGLRAIPDVMSLAVRLARRARHYDVVYANSQKSMIVAGLAGTLARRPVIWHLRDLLTADHFSLAQQRTAVGAANRLVDRVIANSEATAHAFREAGGRVPVPVVYNGIDPAPFRAVRDEQVKALKKELGLEGKPVVGVFSRLAPWKGQHVLLEALEHLAGVQALLVGDVLFEADRGYEEALRAQTERLRLAGRVHFLGFRDDVPALMHLVDVVLHTSTAPEPFGRVIVEAMLAGRPVVATAAGGALELVDDEKTGLLVSPGDAVALGDAIARLIGQPQWAQALAQAGEEAAERRFSAARMTSEVESAVRATLAG